MEQPRGQDDLDVPQQQDEMHPSDPMAKIRTPEQLALLEAAMMEELGIGRKDTLPLEDRGYNDAGLDLQSLKKATKRLNPHDPVARWHNIQFDDVNPAMNELDSIADGQLYRLRRAAARGGIHQASGHSGKGRGLLSYKGGHTASNTGRGANLSSRGGYAFGMGHGFAGLASDPASKYLGHEPPPSIKSKREVSTRTRIEATIARLRVDARLKTKSSKADISQTMSQENHRRHTLRPAQTHAQPASHNYLASPEAFLAKVGFDRTPQKPKPISNSATGHIAKEDDAQAPTISAATNPPTSDQLSTSAAAPGSFTVHVQSSSGSVQKANAVDPLGDLSAVKFSIENSHLSPTPSKRSLALTVKPDVGLAGSRWANPVGTSPAAPAASIIPRNAVVKTPATPVSTAQSPPTETASLGRLALTPSATPVCPSSAARATITSDLSVAPSPDRTMNLESARLGETRFSLLGEYNSVKLVKDGGLSKDGALRIIKHYGHEQSSIQIKPDRVMCFNEQLVGRDTSEVIGPAVMFRTAPGLPLYELTFPNLYEAKHIRESWLTVVQPHCGESPSNNQVTPHSAVEFNTTTSSSVGALGLAVHSGSNHGLVNCNHNLINNNLRQLNDLSQNVSDSQTIGQLVDLHVPVQHRASNRLRNDILHDLSTLEECEQLISLDDNDEDYVDSSETLSSALEDLFDLDDESLLEGALDNLNSGLNNSFLQKISRLITTSPDNSKLVTIDQILTTPGAVNFAEKLVEEFLRRSEIFNMLALSSAANVVRRKTRRILEMAIAWRDESQSDEASKLGSSINADRRVNSAAESGSCYHIGNSISEQACNASEGRNFVNQITSAAKVPFSTASKQMSGSCSNITYTAEELLKLRSKVSTIRFEILAKDSLAWKKHHYLVRPSRVSPVAKVLATSLPFRKAAIATQSDTTESIISPAKPDSQRPTNSDDPAASNGGSKTQQSCPQVLRALLPHEHCGLAPLEENPANLPLAEQHEHSVKTTAQQDTSVLPSVQQIKLPETESSSQESAKPVAVKSDEISLPLSVQESSSPPQSELMKVTGSSRESESGKSSKLTNATRQNIIRLMEPLQGIQTVQKSQAAIYDLPAATLSASPQTKTSRLSASAKEFNQIAHDESVAQVALSTSRHRPTSSEWEFITTNLEALSLQPKRRPQDMQSGFPLTKEHLGSARLPLSIQLPSTRAVEQQIPVQNDMNSALFHTMSSSTTTQPPVSLCSTGILSPLPTFSNISFQSGPGLGASRWATAGNSSTLMPEFPQPMLTPNQSNAPLIQTVLIPHPITGEMQEFTGMVKAGSVPVVAHVPVPRVSSGPPLKENIPMPKLQVPLRTPLDFKQSQSLLFHPRNGNAPSGPETFFRPNAPAFNPAGQMLNEQRTPQKSSPSLTPSASGLFVPTNEDIQATQWYRNIARSDSQSPGSFYW